jgi:dolichol-phosphate mannosyltransferase
LFLTVVIPTYNEAENLPKLISALLDLPLPEFSILIVDDDSPDGTGDIADAMVERHPGQVSVMHRAGKQGLGTAYIQGFQKAIRGGADLIAQMDADFSHSPQKLVEMYDAIGDCDVVIGSRYVQGGKLDERWPLWRKALSLFGNLYAQAILMVPVKDLTAGFRMWRRDTLMGMPLEKVRSNGYAFQIEMAYIAHRLGYKIKEIPIYFAERNVGESKMSFQIQSEAAIRVWQLLWEYRDLKPVK